MTATEERMKDNNTPQKEIWMLAAGEIAVCALVVIIFLIANLLGIHGFDYMIVTGALLGAAVTVANYILMT